MFQKFPFNLLSLESTAPKLSLCPSDGFDIPTDLLIEILKRLPLETLIRLTCVCKYWLSLVTSPIFIAAHTSHNLNSYNWRYPNCHLFKEPVNVYTSSFFTSYYLYKVGTFTQQDKLDCPVGQNHFVVCSRDGLVCLFDFYSSDPRTSPVILWNPSIRRAIAVPVPGDGDVDVELTAGGFPKLVFGFGFDPVSNDYKLVRVAYFNGGEYGVGTCFRADVYDLRVGDWRILERFRVGRDFSTIRWRGVCLNGVIHWVCNANVGSNDGDGGEWSGQSILTFKLGSEEFGEMKIPKELADVKHEKVRVVTVPTDSKEVLGVVKTVGSVLSVWVMDEYGVEESWVKMLTVDFGKMVIKHDMNVVVLNDEVVLAQMTAGMWICKYDKMIGNSYLVPTAILQLDHVDTYVESLILLGHQSRYGVEVLPCGGFQLAGRKRKCFTKIRMGKPRAIRF